MCLRVCLCIITMMWKQFTEADWTEAKKEANWTNSPRFTPKLRRINKCWNLVSVYPSDEIHLFLGIPGLNSLEKFHAALFAQIVRKNECEKEKQCSDLVDADFWKDDNRTQTMKPSIISFQLIHCAVAFFRLNILWKWIAFVLRRSRNLHLIGFSWSDSNLSFLSAAFLLFASTNFLNLQFDVEFTYSLAICNIVFRSPLDTMRKSEQTAKYLTMIMMTVSLRKVQTSILNG